MSSSEKKMGALKWTDLSYEEKDEVSKINYIVSKMPKEEYYHVNIKDIELLVLRNGDRSEAKIPRKKA
jgi:hypothetical protein